MAIKFQFIKTDKRFKQKISSKTSYPYKDINGQAGTSFNLYKGSRCVLTFFYRTNDYIKYQVLNE